MIAKQCLSALGPSILVLLAGGGTLLAEEAASISAKVIAEQRELDRRLIEAHDQKNVEKIVGLFSGSPDVFFIRPNGILHRGRANIRRSYEGFFATLDSIRGELKEVRYLPAENGVIAVGTVVFHRKPKNAPADQRTVIWTDYRRVEGGKWVFVFRHAHWPVETRNGGSVPRKGATFLDPPQNNEMQRTKPAQAMELRR
jgi:ketosteroid isomerase-like protein